VKDEEHTWIREQPKTFYDGIREFVDGYKNCVELQGSYSEK